MSKPTIETIKLIDYTGNEPLKCSDCKSWKGTAKDAAINYYGFSKDHDTFTVSCPICNTLFIEVKFPGFGELETKVENFESIQASVLIDDRLYSQTDGVPRLSQFYELLRCGDFADSSDVFFLERKTWMVYENFTRKDCEAHSLKNFLQKTKIKSNRLMFYYLAGQFHAGTRPVEILRAMLIYAPKELEIYTDHVVKGLSGIIGSSIARLK